MDYHDDYSHVSCSMLKVYMDSPVDYYNLVTGKVPPKEPTPEMITGTVVHAVLLEHKELGQVIREYPANCYKSNGSLNPVPAAAFREECEIHGQLAVKEYESLYLRDLIEAAYASQLGQVIREATSCEMRYDAELWGVPCKCKPDICCNLGDRIVIYDLKVCPPNPSHFHRSAKKFRYWLQDAHYSAVLQKQYKVPVTFRFFALEPDYPYRVHAHWYEPRERELARASHESLVKRLRKSMRTNTWVDEWTNSIPLHEWDIDQVTSEKEIEPEYVAAGVGSDFH